MIGYLESTVCQLNIFSECRTRVPGTSISIRMVSGGQQDVSGDIREKFGASGYVGLLAGNSETQWVKATRCMRVSGLMIGLRDTWFKQ